MKKASAYNRYIDSSNCTSYDLGWGDTFFSVQSMKDWVLQDYKQVSKLAIKLKKHSLSETINSIHKFLHTHIAYKEDKELQKIKSPGCTWATRKKGTDCKTFSVFASSLLLNMGIPHAIRQVRQPGVNSHLWTHVYVVVPIDPNDKKIKGDYYVLDGTVRSNREVRILEKNDEFMQNLPHIGLRGAQYAGQYNSRGLNGDVTKGFNTFLEMLLGVGVSSNTVQAIRSAVGSYTSQGVDFPFQINSQGVVVGTTLYPYISKSNRSQGLKDAWGYVEKKISRGLSKAPNDNPGDGITIEQVASEVLSSGFFQRTFGAVFANGFDLSCFGSATNEQKMTQNVGVDLPWYLERSGLKQSTTEANIRKLFYELEVYRFGAEVLTRSKFAKCTRKAGKLGKEATESFIQYMIGAIDGTLASQNKRLVQITDRSASGPHEVPTKSGRGGGSIRLGETLQVLNFRVEAIPNTPQTNTPPPPVTDNPPIPQIITTKPKPKPKPNPSTTTVKPSFGVRPGSSSNSKGGGNSKNGSNPDKASLGTAGTVLLAAGTLYGVSKLYSSTKAKSN